MPRIGPAPPTEGAGMSRPPFPTQVAAGRGRTGEDRMVLDTRHRGSGRPRRRRGAGPAGTTPHGRTLPAWATRGSPGPGRRRFPLP